MTLAASLRLSLSLLVAAAALLFAGLPQARADYPPTDGAMSGFVLIKERVAAPTVPFQLADGSETDLTAFRGKVLIVNFWATWCAPCIKEMPSLDRLQAAFPGEAFEVVAISQDRGGARVANRFCGKSWTCTIWRSTWTRSSNWAGPSRTAVCPPPMPSTGTVIWSAACSDPPNGIRRTQRLWSAICCKSAPTAERGRKTERRYW